MHRLTCAALCSFYDFVTTTNLVVNTRKAASSTVESTTPTADPQTKQNSKSNKQDSDEDSDSDVQSTSIKSVLPNSLPSKIVPGDGASMLKSFDNVTLVSFLFDQDQLPWPFLCDSPDTVAQIFRYGPAMVSSVLNVSSTDMTNSALVAYQKLDTEDVDQLASVYLLYVPNESVDSLQQLVSSTKSKFYVQDGVQGQLAKQVDPSLKLTAFVSSDSATVDGKKSKDDDDDDGDDKSKTTIVAVCSSFGGVIALLIGVLVFRHYRDKHPKDEAPNLRELQLGPNSPPVTGQRSPFATQRTPMDPRFSGASVSQYTASHRPMSYMSDASGHSYESAPADPMTRGVSWYSGHYTDWNGEEPQTVYGAAITDEQHSPFSDPQRSSGGSSENWQRQRDEGVRRLKTGQVAISRPTLAGNSLMCVFSLCSHCRVAFKLTFRRLPSRL